jgi:hypothetical protein
MVYCESKGAHLTPGLCLSLPLINALNAVSLTLLPLRILILLRALTLSPGVNCFLIQADLVGGNATADAFPPAAVHTKPTYENCG